MLSSFCPCIESIENVLIKPFVGGSSNGFHLLAQLDQDYYIVVYTVKGWSSIYANSEIIDFIDSLRSHIMEVGHEG